MHRHFDLCLRAQENKLRTFISFKQPNRLLKNAHKTATLGSIFDTLEHLKDKSGSATHIGLA